MWPKHGRRMAIAEIWSINIHGKLCNKIGSHPQTCKEYGISQNGNMKNLILNRYILNSLLLDQVIFEHFYSFK